jgi:hypothetical protein
VFPGLIHIRFCRFEVTARLLIRIECVTALDKDKDNDFTCVVSPAHNIRNSSLVRAHSHVLLFF